MTREEVIQLELDLIEAIKKSDTNFIDKVLHPDLLFLAPNGQVVTKEMDLASHRAGEMIVEQLLPTFEELSIIGDTVLSIVVYDTQGTMLGKPIQGQFRYIRTWQQFSDGIKVIGGACVQIL